MQTDFGIAGLIVAASIVALLGFALRVRRTEAALPASNLLFETDCPANCETEERPRQGFEPPLQEWPIFLLAGESSTANRAAASLCSAMQSEFDRLQMVLGAAGLRPVVRLVDAGTDSDTGSEMQAAIDRRGLCCLPIRPCRLQLSHEFDGGLLVALTDTLRAESPSDHGLPTSLEIACERIGEDAVSLVAMMLARLAAGNANFGETRQASNRRALLLDAATGILARAELEGQKFLPRVQLLACWCAAERARLDDDDGAIADTIAKLRAILAPLGPLQAAGGLQPEEEGGAAANLADLLDRHARASERPHAVLLEAVDWAERSQDLLEPITRPEARAELAMLRARLLTRLALRERQPRYLEQAHHRLEAARSVWRPDHAPAGWLRATLAIGETMQLEAEMTAAGQAHKLAGELFASALALPEISEQFEALARAKCGLGWNLLLEQGEIDRAGRLGRSETNFRAALGVAAGQMPAELRGNLRLGMAVLQARRICMGTGGAASSPGSAAGGAALTMSGLAAVFDECLANFELAFALAGDAIAPSRQALAARDVACASGRIVASVAGSSAATLRSHQLAVRAVRLLESIALNLAGRGQSPGVLEATAYRGLGDALMVLATIERGEASLGLRAIAAYLCARAAFAPASRRETVETDLALARAHRLVHEAGRPQNENAPHFLAACTAYEGVIEAMRVDPTPLLLGALTAEYADMLAVEGSARAALPLCATAAAGFETALALLRQSAGSEHLTPILAKLAQLRVATARLQPTPANSAAARTALFAAYEAASVAGELQLADDARRELAALEAGQIGAIRS